MIIIKKIRYILENSIEYKDGEGKINFEQINKKFPITTIEECICEKKCKTNPNSAMERVVTATQLAIWHYSDKFINKIDTDEDKIVIGENIDDLELINRKGKDLSCVDIYNTRSLYKSMIENTNESYDNTNIHVDVAKIVHKDPIISVNEDNPDKIDVEFILKISGDQLSQKSYEVKLNGSKIDVYPEPVGDGFIRIKVDDIPLETDIKIITSAKQNLGSGGVYFLKPEGGRDISQSLVGVKSGVIDIYKELNYKCIQLQGLKKLIGKDLKEGMFNFKVYEDDKEVAWGTNNKDGIIKFSPIIYSKEGSHNYVIEEERGNSSDILYDEKKFEVGVNVIRKNGTLVATPIYPYSGVVFNNTYKEESTSATIKATKTLTGKNLKSGMFRFKLLDEDGNVVETVKNDAAGNIKFSELTFDEVGTYTYQIVEVDEGSDGIIYDSQPVDVKIKVEDKDGKLKTSVSYPSKDPEFKNEYKPGSTSAVIEATKTLEGKDLESGMFSFELLDEEDNRLQIVKNSRNGKVRFKAINYDKAGTYKYTVKEVKETLDGIDYDDSEYEVTVKVTDDGNGNLKAEVVYPEGGIVFENTVIEGALEFTKTDVSTGNVIDGAEIKITCIEGLDKGKVIEFTSSKEGNKFELKAGKYTFEEIQAPEGYELTKEVGTFEIKENGEVVKAELKNYPIKGSVKLIKVDKDDKEKRIQGAKFVLLGSDKETIIAENLVTDSEGKIIVSNLEPGTYYFKETEAASGYILDDTLIEVKVESNQQTISTVTFENEKEQEGGGLPDIDPEGDIPEEEGGSLDTDSNVSSPNTNNNTNSNVSSPNTNTNNNTNSNVNSSTNSSGSYPKTSDISIAGYAISGIVSIGTLVGINRKRKDK